uniref:Uncharacterized protein n=1 Tax=Brassica oleracea var. oleracea TaxID=109376 RepID=A0A0D3CG47_BRAOL
MAAIKMVFQIWKTSELEDFKTTSRKSSRRRMRKGLRCPLRKQILDRLPDVTHRYNRGRDGLLGANHK